MLDEIILPTSRFFDVSNQFRHDIPLMISWENQFGFLPGAIDIDEHRHYVERRDRIYARQAEALITDIRRCAP